MLGFHAARLTLVAEELNAVCDGGVSRSPGWRKVINQGRTQGLTVYALSQRPALIDKDTLGNASLTRCGRLNWEPDAKLMAKMMRCRPDDLLDMPKFHFIAKADTGEITQGIGQRV